MNSVVIFSAAIIIITDHCISEGRFLLGKTCVKRPLSKRPKIHFPNQLLLDAGQKYCRMLQVEHSAILTTFNKLPIVIRIFVLSIFEWPIYTGFTVIFNALKHHITR